MAKAKENKLSIDINKEQPAETPFTDTFKEMHRQYQKGNELLRQQYKDKLWQEVITNLSKNKEELVKIFLQITDSTITTAEAAIHELKLYYYNDATSACQYVLKIAKDDFSKTEAHKRLNIIQNNIVKLCGANHGTLKPITNQADIDRLCHRGELQALRDLTRESLKELEEIKEKDEKLYINKTAGLFKTIASGMEQYLAGLYKEAESIIGAAPCKYTVIGFGSMALRQTTPYSDLECAILTENDNYRQSGNQLTRNYFKNLSHLVHFMIINLGETIIPTSRYGFDLSEFIPQAVNFDLGGKTPLGRIEQDKPYDLVQTVDGMLRYLRNEEHKTEHMDKNLPNILQKICFVHGDKTLADGYQNQAEEFLQSDDESGRPNCEARAAKVLSEGVCELNYTEAPANSKLIKGDLELFDFKPYKSVGNLFDVKQEIYRLPDRLIYYLGLIHGVQGDGSWDTLDKLCEFGKISLDGAGNLKKALTFATNLRLKTYDHYGYQKETMDFSKSYRQNLTESEGLIEAISGTFKLKKGDLKPDGALFKYYKVVMPLHSKLEEFCTKKDIENKDNFFANEIFYSNTPKTLAKIHFRLLQYEAFVEQQLLELEKLKDTLGQEHPDVATSLNNVDVATSLNNVGVTYGELGQHELALKYQLEALELWKKVLGQEHPNLATSQGNVGTTYGELGQHELALQYKLEALEMTKELLGPEHPDIARSLNNVGFTYGALGNHKEALRYLLEALELWKKVLGQEHPDVATSLGNVGSTYNELGKHELALKYKLEALEMNKKLLGPEHPDVARSLNNVGFTYGTLGNHKEALRYQLEALKLRKKLLGQEHPNVATSLNNVGGTYGDLGQHDKALRYQLEALEMNKKLLGQEHPNVAQSLNNVGGTYNELGKHEEALRYQLEALEMNKKLLGQEHPNVAQSLNNVGLTYKDLGRHEEALRYKLEALELRKKLLDQEHPDVAQSLNNVGTTYSDLGKHEEALRYLLEALAMAEKLLGTEHPHVAMSLNNVGGTYGELGKHEEALRYKLEALEMNKKVLGIEHPSVAASLNNVGITYGELGKYEEALKYQLEALKLKKKLLSPEHPHVALSLNNVGGSYGELGNHKEALRYHKEALEMNKKVLGIEHPSVAASLNNVGITYGELGKYEEALQYQLEALKLRKKLLSPEHPHVALSLNNVGWAYGKLSKHELALRYLLEALELRKKLLGQEHPDVARSLNNVGGSYGELGNHKEALRYHKEALELSKKVLGQEHPDVAGVYNNFIGIACKEAGISPIPVSAFIERYKILKEDLSSLNVNVMLFDEFVNLFLFGDNSDFH
jgi:tetratricopeptide (TPR) repeat protein/sulfur relay (sulfurtransferase) complex TusBCD TusD component (DsrE family)